MGDRFIPLRKSEEHAKSLYALAEEGQPEDDKPAETAQIKNFPFFLAQNILNLNLSLLPGSCLTHKKPSLLYWEPPLWNASLKNSLLSFQSGFLNQSSLKNCWTNNDTPPASGPEEPSRQPNQFCDAPLNENTLLSPLPLKILDAPGLLDDFYFDLLDWGKRNIIAVSLSNRLYSWNAETFDILKVSELSSFGRYYTSVKWDDSGTLLSLGTSDGVLEVWDGFKMKKVIEFGSHSLRVGKIQWLSETRIATGSRDNKIMHHDLRTPHSIFRMQEGHRQEVCGLKWSKECELLASGGNDNKVMLWSLHKDCPILAMKYHNSAVKALEWNPHERGVLLSGGGTNDKTIKAFNTRTEKLVHNVDVGNQVCNIVFSPHSNDFACTYGFTSNEIGVWNWASMKQTRSLEGHSKRVLYVGLSPDHEKIATAAGDEVIKLWEVFPVSRLGNASSKTSPMSVQLR